MIIKLKNKSFKMTLKTSIGAILVKDVDSE